MVGGLDRFRDHFKDHTHQYALIGGSACDLLMEQVALPFRATKDLDIVLMAESTDGTPRFYRFCAPQASGFPSMLELFSIRPARLPPVQGISLTPIPFDDGISSLSAILLDEQYYAFLKAGVRLVEGVSVVGAEHLVPLKARAWLDLTERKAAGNEIDGKDIRKHRNDVFRLYQIIDPAARGDLPPIVRADMRRFLIQVKSEQVDLQSLGLAQSSLGEVLDQLGKVYGAG